MSSANHFLLRELLEELVSSSNENLVVSLRRLNYFGRLIKNQQLIDFTQNELDGYSNPSDVPEYRVLPGVLLVDLKSWDGDLERNIEIPWECLEEKFIPVMSQVRVTEPIGIIGRLETENSESNEIAKPIPVVFLPHIQKAAEKCLRANFDYSVSAAKVGFNKNKLYHIPQLVHSKLVAFIMELAETFGDDIKLDTFKKDQHTNNETVIKIMNTIINNKGDGNVLNTGDNATQNVSIVIQKGDIATLKKKLLNDGIDSEDVKEIEEVLQNEKPDYENKRLGARAIEWIKKVSGKALQGVGKIATSVSSSVLAEYLKQYYGLDR